VKIGVLVVASTDTKRAFSSEELAVLQTVAAEAALALERLRSSVALSDALGREQTVAAITRRIRAELPSVDVVFYTGMDDLGVAERAFSVGAQGVVSKGDAAADLLKAVLLASRERSYISPVFAAHADRRDFEDLSPKQIAVLRLLARGLERKQIAERMGIGEETVKSHLAEVRRKLGVRTGAQAVAIGLINSLFEYEAP